jgi:hypothetical protein
MLLQKQEYRELEIQKIREEQELAHQISMGVIIGGSILLLIIFLLRGVSMI